MNPAIEVSDHAVARYMQRIGASREEALAVLHGPVVRIAATFGARVVRLARGRIILRLTPAGAAVITVVPLDWLPIQLIPPAWGGVPTIAVDRYFPNSRETSLAHG